MHKACQKNFAKIEKSVLTLSGAGGIQRPTLRRRIAERLNDFFSVLRVEFITRVTSGQ
jgi:hypothetical protein